MGAHGQNVKLRETSNRCSGGVIAWTKYRGLDPEGRFGVTDQAITPPLQRLLVSLNFTF